MLVKALKEIRTWRGKGGGGARIFFISWIQNFDLLCGKNKTWNIMTNAFPLQYERLLPEASANVRIKHIVMWLHFLLLSHFILRALLQNMSWEDYINDLMRE